MGLRWIVGSVVIIVVVAGTVRLGFWQLDRLEGRKDSNAAVAVAMAAPPVPLGSAEIPATLNEYQRVSVTGRWEPSLRVLLRYPIRDGQQGYEVLEPLRVGEGLILVNRGWVTQDAGRSMTKAPAGSPGEQVTVEGFVRNPEVSNSDIGDNGAAPGLPTITEVDIGRIQPLFGGDLKGEKRLTDRWVQLIAPAGATDPLPVARPELSEGSHFSYALQWFSFGAIALVGWIALVVRGRRPEDPMFEDETIAQGRQGQTRNARHGAAGGGLYSSGGDSGGGDTSSWSDGGGGGGDGGAC